MSKVSGPKEDQGRIQTHVFVLSLMLEWVAIPSQGIFPTQGSNLGLLHYRQILYHLSLQGSPLEGNIGGKLHNIEMGNDLLDVIPSAEVAKDKLDKLDFVKIFKFCASKHYPQS